MAGIAPTPSSPRSQIRFIRVQRARPLNLSKMMVRLLSAFICFVLTLLGPQAGWAQRVWDLPRDGDSLYARAELVFGRSPKTIEVSTYELRADDVGLSLIAGLVDAARRGARVRLVVDNKIQDNIPGLADYLERHGVEIRFHNPIELHWGDILHPIKAWNRINRRMHDKMFIVDGEIALIGDKNYKGKFFHVSTTGQKDEQTMTGKELVVEGVRECQLLREYFEKIWNEAPLVQSRDRKVFSASEEKALEESLSDKRKFLRTILGRRNRRPLDERPHHPFSDFEVLQDTIERSPSGGEKRVTTLAKILEILKQAPSGTPVLIENSYFVLFPELVEVLEDLKRRQVDVHVVLNAPEVTDQRIIGEALRIDLPKMLELGLKVYLNATERRISHAKLLVIGDIVINGSANVDPRSMRINSEMSVKMRSPELAKHLWQRFHRENSLRKQVFEHRSCGAVFMNGYNATVPGLFSPGKAVELIRPQL